MEWYGYRCIKIAKQRPIALVGKSHSVDTSLNKPRKYFIDYSEGKFINLIEVFVVRMISGL